MPTFFFHSGMVGAPTNTDAAGSTLGIIRACLVEGFNVLTPSSASVTSEVMTITYSSAHGYENLVWIRLDGAPTGSIVKRATVTSSTTLTIEAPGFANGAVAGTLSTRVAPADWEEVFTGTRKAVFRSKVVGPGSARFYYRVSDAVDGYQQRMLRGYESMTSVDTGSGAFPSTTQDTGEGFIVVRSSSGTNPWAAVCDGRTVYITLGNYQAAARFASVLWFGDEQPLSSADNFCAAVGANTRQLLSGIYYRARNFAATAASQATNSPSVFATFQTFPSPVFGGLVLVQPRLLLDGTSNFRAILRGGLDTTANPIPNGSVYHVMDSVHGVAGRVIFLRTGHESPHVSAFHDGEWP